MHKISWSIGILYALGQQYFILQVNASKVERLLRMVHID
jgi:hypothetical protein